MKHLTKDFIGFATSVTKFRDRRSNCLYTTSGSFHTISSSGHFRYRSAIRHRI